MPEKIMVGVAGAGAMGSGIAQVAAMAGHKVVLFDSIADSLNKAKTSIQSNLAKLVEKGKLDSGIAKSHFDSIQFTGNSDSFRGCGLVIEAIIENLDVKKELFKSIEYKISSDCILATNTSSLAVVAVASACRVRERVVGIHFFNPATLMQLVEIIPAFTTSPETTERAREIITAWGKTTVLAKDTPGFIVNRIARPFYGEAIKIYEEGIAGIPEIDQAMKTNGGFKMGPFELMDFIGNDINFKVTETVWEQFFYDARYRPSITQKRLYEAGLFGRKSGRGYYRYDKPQEVITDENPMLGKAIFNRILAMLINEAAEALYLNIASREDIDLAMTKGVNYPKGLLKWADETGVGNVLQTLNTLQDDYGEDRYRPSLLLKKMHAEKRTFY